MSKTPIMMLQELMMKQGQLPLYDITEEHSGTHQNLFTYRVKCNELTANGKGTSKKAAKHNAAVAMLQLLGYPTSDQCKQVVSNNANKILTSPAKDKVDIPPSHDESFTNYVGRLQELCTKYNLHQPVYETVDISGPSHLSTFTIRCIIQTLQVDATRTTKKQAKQDAAKKTLEILLNKQYAHEICQQYSCKINEQCTNKVMNQTEGTTNIIGIKEEPWDIQKLEELGILITDLSIEDSRSKTEVEEIKTLYKELQQPHKVKPQQVYLEDYHTYFKQKYNVNDIVRKSLLLMSVAPKDKVKEAIDLISKEFAAMKRIIFPNHNQQLFAVGFRLESVPVILEIGMGGTISDAEEHALKNVIKTILLMIS